MLRQSSVCGPRAGGCRIGGDNPSRLNFPRIASEMSILANGGKLGGHSQSQCLWFSYCSQSRFLIVVQLVWPGEPQRRLGAVSVNEECRLLWPGLVDAF